MTLKKNEIYRILIVLPSPQPLSEFTSSRKFYEVVITRKKPNQTQTEKGETPPNQTAPSRTVEFREMSCILY